jgi:cytochrome b involved in lipid metabolism
MVKYFTPDEVSMHNCAADCWVSIFENVYDLTTLLEENKGE